MPWKVRDHMSSRREFVLLASQEGANVAQLCRNFGVSRKTAYKWLSRAEEEGEQGLGGTLGDHSRRPLHSPNQTAKEVERKVLDIREAHPAWGGRKIRARLCHLAVTDSVIVPSASTITEILRRNGLIDPRESAKRVAYRRFERESPNELWQMDFKGHFALSGSGRCHPLTVLDDHSRYAVGLQACGDEKGETVQRELTKIFRTHGIPWQMLMDNGSPWGGADEFGESWLTVWMMKLGIRVSHGRPYHPQTQGKDERFHRTLKAEVLSGEPMRNLEEASRRFARWREVYNGERPHEALGMATPVSRYRVSERKFPETIPSFEYGDGDAVRKVQSGGWLNFEGTEYRLSKAFRGEAVAIRVNVTQAELREVWFRQQLLGHLDLREKQFSRRAFRREV